MSYIHADGYAIVAGDPMQGGGESPDDRDVICTFKRVARINPRKSLEAGRKVYDNVDMAYLSVRTDSPRTTVPKLATKEVQQRFARQWAEYQQRMANEQPVNGMPLAQWPEIDPASLQMFHDDRIYTVEQVAERGPDGWRDRAEKWLRAESEKDAEIERLKALIESMKPAVDEADEYAEFPGERGVSLVEIRRGRPPGSKNKPKE